jgi:hypothetical protein
MNNKDDKLDTLTELLNQLQLTNASNAHTINEAQTIINELRQQSKSTTVKSTKEVKRKTKRGTKPEVGDIVVIVNPKGNQPKEGTVIGYTAAGFVKVKGKNGQIVRRIPLNLIIKD